MDTSADLATLEHWVRAPTTQQRVALRSRMVLLLATGLSAREVARRIGVSETIVVTDAPAILRSAMLTVTENVVVTDTPNLTVPNSSPAVNAGPDRNVEATSAAGASVALSGVASDGDGDPLTLTWSGPCGSAAGCRHLDDHRVRAAGPGAETVLAGQHYGACDQRGRRSRHLLRDSIYRCVIRSDQRFARLLPIQRVDIPDWNDDGQLHRHQSSRPSSA